MSSEEIVYIVFQGKPEIFRPGSDSERALQDAQSRAADLCEQTRQTHTIMCVPGEYADTAMEARWHGVVIHASEEGEDD